MCKVKKYSTIIAIRRVCMTQKEIMDALQKALNQGSGSLDDLGNLLARVQVDIEQAKKEEAEAKRKSEAERGERIARIATAMLQDKLTAEDMAFIFNEYFKDAKCQWTAKDIEEIKQHSQEAEKITNDLNVALNDLAATLQDVFNAAKPTPAPKSNVENKKSADDVLKKFLKDFGLA